MRWQRDERAPMLKQAHRNAYVAAGGGRTPSASPLLWELYLAGGRLAEYWERRAMALQRQLQAVLALDVLDDEQRAEVVRTVSCKARDAKLLTAGQREALDVLSELQPPDKAAVIELLGHSSLRSASAAFKR